MAKLLLPMPNIPMQDKDGKMNLQWRKWFEGGGAILRGDATLPEGALPDSVKTIVNSGGVSGKLYMGSDGESVSFGGTFGTIPTRIEADISVLPTPSVGAYYACYAENITATGFIVKAKVRTPSATILQTTGAGTSVGDGSWTVQKPISDDAYNQVYTYDFDANLERISFNSLVATYRGIFALDFYNGTEWVNIKNETITTTIAYDPLDPVSSILIPNNIISVLITQPIGLAVGSQAEFRIRPVQGSIFLFNEVTYETQTYTETSLGTQKIKFWVYA